jgi:hypothetical protein
MLTCVKQLLSNLHLLHHVPFDKLVCARTEMFPPETDGLYILQLIFILTITKTYGVFLLLPLPHCRNKEAGLLSEHVYSTAHFHPHHHQYLWHLFSCRLTLTFLHSYCHSLPTTV